MTTRYAVRCCCQPQKVFGYLELADGLDHGDEVIFPILRELTRADFERPDDPIATSEALVRYERIKLKRYGLPDQWEVAVYSDDRPLEFWRQFPGFTESSR